MRLNNVQDIDENLAAFLAQPGYAMCELIEDSSQGPAFKTTSKKLESGEMISAPLDELAPKLSDEEFQRYRYFDIK